MERAELMERDIQLRQDAHARSAKAPAKESEVKLPQVNLELRAESREPKPLEQHVRLGRAENLATASFSALQLFGAIFLWAQSCTQSLLLALEEGCC